jgi:hypothetical protein
VQVTPRSLAAPELQGTDRDVPELKAAPEDEEDAA